MDSGMDNFFRAGSDTPLLSQTELDRMTEVALSYRQHAPANESRKARGWATMWAGAFGMAACVVIAVGVLYTPASTSVSPGAQPDTVAEATATADDDAYADITELAILDTFGGY